MDLAKKDAPDFNFGFLKFLFYLPGIYLVFVVLRLLFTKGQQAAIEQFVFLRNSFYLAFIFFSIIFGVLAILKKNFQKIIPDQVNGIILITFAYSLAKIVFDLLNYLFLLNLR